MTDHNDDNNTELENPIIEDEGSEDETGPEDVRGPRPGFREALRNKCFDCCGDMIDGRQDCQIVTCSLYYWQPYRKLTPDLSWRTEGYHLAKNRAALRTRLNKSVKQDAPDVSDQDDPEEDHDA